MNSKSWKKCIANGALKNLHTLFWFFMELFVRIGRLNTNCGIPLWMRESEHNFRNHFNKLSAKQFRWHRWMFVINDNVSGWRNWKYCIQNDAYVMEFRFHISYYEHYRKFCVGCLKIFERSIQHWWQRPVCTQEVLADFIKSLHLIRIKTFVNFSTKFEQITFAEYIYPVSMANWKFRCKYPKP